ncbi:MAG: hypothetical protein AW08_03404 [Candidatus Accumulibacter adjunctus]|uniref:Uncharacterized protein n=1 Tax=Candidatus Accumulibacter adjunctus TaxID=1454001 RepID=A0A011MRL5_9PROT|nr:MAG: hypothetical protein AW08_03404 [Candidatus Accumulibacter adjunctus]
MPAQLVERAEIHELHRHLVESGEVLLEILQLLAELQHEQAQQPGAVRLRRFGRRIEDAQRDAFAVGDQRRMTEHQLPTAGIDLHQLRQRAKAPVAQIRILARRLVQLGKLLSRRASPFGAQLVQVAAQAELAAALV